MSAKLIKRKQNKRFNSYAKYHSKHLETRVLIAIELPFREVSKAKTISQFQTTMWQTERERESERERERERERGKQSTRTCTETHRQTRKHIQTGAQTHKETNTQTHTHTHMHIHRRQSMQAAHRQNIRTHTALTHERCVFVSLHSWVKRCSKMDENIGLVPYRLRNFKAEIFLWRESDGTALTPPIAM